VFGTVGGVLLSHIGLWLPVFVGGLALVGMAATLILVMPETGFQPLPRTERGSWQAMFATTRAGLQVVRTRPYARTIVIIGLLYGIQSEGFDRLWEAHLLKNFEFPIFAGLQPQDWFGVISLSSTVISLITSELVVRHVDSSSAVKLTRALAISNTLISVSVIGLALAGNFALAVVALWLRVVAGTIGGPLYNAWLNQNLNPKVRATVLSFSSQVDALGQSLGGPVVGAIGNGFGLRAALTMSGLLLMPVSLLYGRATQRGDVQAKANEESQPLVSVESQPPI
jgi:MFS transporter, DHA3 family, tetracycline resistance protein